MTEWRPIPGYEGLYEVSDDGQVRSLERKVFRLDKWGLRASLKVKEKLLKITEDKSYCYVRLYNDSGGTTIGLGRLMLLTFVGPPPNEKAVCRHKDGDFRRCVVSNLEWGSHSDNCMDAVRHGTHRSTKQNGENHPRTKLTWAQVNRMREMWNSQQVTQASLGEIFGLTQGAVSSIVNNKKWKRR